MEKQQTNNKNKIIITVLLALIALSLVMFSYGFTTSGIAEASEEAVNLLNNEVILKKMQINDDESIMLNEINYALDITEGTTYRIYVNIDGLEVVKEINCVCTSSDNIGFEDGPAVTLGSMGEYACFLIYDDNEEKGAIIGFANNATCEIINEEGLNTLRKDNNGFFWCMYYGMAINNVTVHAVTLASDPLMSFEVEPTSSKGIVGQITDSFTTFITGVGESIVNMFDNLFITDGELSTLAVVALSMLGLGLATGLTTMLLSKFTK